MALQFLCNGYSGYFGIGESKDSYNIAFLTSYNLSRNFNIIRSNSNAPLYVSSSWKRFCSDLIYDYSFYELSVDLELTKQVFNLLIGKLKTDGNFFHQTFSIIFEDTSSGLKFKFEKAFLSSFNLGVSNNSIATASLSFKIYKQEFELEMDTTTMQEKTNSTVRNKLNDLKGTTLLPYYSWGFKLPPFSDSNLPVMNFSFNFSHQLNQKFLCSGSASQKPSYPDKIIFSVPEITYEVTYLIDSNGSKKYNMDENSLDIENHVFHFTSSGGNGKQITIQYKSTTVLTCKNSIINSIVPSVGNSDSPNTVTISGNVFGKITSNIIK